MSARARNSETDRKYFGYISISRRQTVFHETVFVSEILSDECASTKLGVTENFVSSLYLLIQSSTLKSVLSTVLTALATLLHVN